AGRIGALGDRGGGVVGHLRVVPGDAHLGGEERVRTGELRHVLVGQTVQRRRGAIGGRRGGCGGVVGGRAGGGWHAAQSSGVCPRTRGQRSANCQAVAEGWVRRWWERGWVWMGSHQASVPGRPSASARSWASMRLVTLIVETTTAIAASSSVVSR